MTTRHQQHQIGIGHAVCQTRGQSVSSKVIDAVNRKVGSSGQPFGTHDTRQHASDQSRPRGNGNRVDISQTLARVGQCVLYSDIDLFSMGTGRDLRDDAPKTGVQVGLADDNRRQNLRRLTGHATDHSGGGIIATAFDPKNGARVGHNLSKLHGVVWAGNTGMRPKQSRSLMSLTRATLLLTRPAPASAAFLDSLSPLGEGIDVVISPLLEIVPTGQVPDTSQYAGVIFTSSNGVAHAIDGAGMPAFCIGDATRDAAQARGWEARQMGRTAEDLIDSILSERPNAPLLHIGGVHKRGNVAEHLTRAGIHTDSIDVYDQTAKPLSSVAIEILNGGNPVIVPLFSPRTASQFAKNWSGRAPLHLLGLSKAVLDEVKHLPASTFNIAESPDGDAMRRVVMNLLRRVEARDAPK